MLSYSGPSAAAVSLTHCTASGPLTFFSHVAIVVVSSASFGAKCSIIFNLCYAHLLPRPINPCQPQGQMEEDDCTLSIDAVEFLSRILRTWPEAYSEDSNGRSGFQFTDGPSPTRISDIARVTISEKSHSGSR